jgi:hypothetical protein
MFSEWALKNGGTLFPIFFSSSLTSSKSFLNPSLSISDDGTGTFVFRTTNYRYLRPVRNLSSLTSTGSIQYLCPKSTTISNAFFFAHHDFSSSNQNFSTTIEIDRIHSPIVPPNKEFDFSAIEDLRICRFGTTFILLGNIATAEGMRRPFFCEIDPIQKNQNQVPLLNLQTIEISNMNKVEKNWLPIEGRYGEFIRWPISLQKSGTRFAQVVSILQPQLHTPNFREQPNLYGGSQFARYKEGYISVIHFRKNGIRKNNHQYFHQFFFYDINLRFVKSSKPFCFLGFDTEFCSGIATYKDKIYVSFSCNDGLNFVLSFNLAARIWDGDQDF